LSWPAGSRGRVQKATHPAHLVEEEQGFDGAVVFVEVVDGDGSVIGVCLLFEDNVLEVGDCSDFG
jgi:hypothetical protein